MADEESKGLEVAQPAEPAARPSAAARKRAAVEMIARHDSSLRRTARRYSLCAEDAEDAYQRALEILLTKAPSDRPLELVRWTHTVIKHEALAVRRHRERLLGAVPHRPHAEGAGEDWVALIPASGDGPEERLERGERVARSREALQALKPAELRALTLLAAGCSYAEISEMTGFSRTKVNRCLAEGRERFRSLVSRSEDGSHCAEMHPLLSAFCDGEASPAQERAVREHLRACAACRATMRAYRAAPGVAAALIPSLPPSRSLLERAQDFLTSIQLRLSGGEGGATDSAAAQVAAAGGTRGAGMAAIAKLLAVCAGTAGGAAACVATGVAPVPLASMHETKSAKIERVAPAAMDSAVAEPVEIQPPSPQPAPETQWASEPQEAAEPVETGAVEYEESTPAPAAATEPPATSSGSAAGEFGP